VAPYLEPLAPPSRVVSELVVRSVAYISVGPHMIQLLLFLWRRDFLYFRIGHDWFDLLHLLFCHSRSLSHLTPCDFYNRQKFVNSKKRPCSITVLRGHQASAKQLYACLRTCEATFRASWETSTWPSLKTWIDYWLSTFPIYWFYPFLPPYFVLSSEKSGSL
jgi:hypothetical protein